VSLYDQPKFHAQFLGKSQKNTIHLHFPQNKSHFMIFRIAPAFSTSTSFPPLLGFACSMPGKSKTYSEKMVVKNGDESHGTQEKNHLKQIQSTSCKKKSLGKNQSTKLKQTPIILNKLQELLSFPSGWSLIFFQPLCALPLYSGDPIYRPFEWWKEGPYPTSFITLVGYVGKTTFEGRKPTYPNS